MRKAILTLLAGALGAVALAGCVGVPGLDGAAGGPPMTELTALCGTANVDYGAEAESVYPALLDAYVANRRGGISKEKMCAFQSAIAERHAAYAANPTREAQSGWASFVLGQRAQALSWRANVDPTLRAG